MEEGIERDFSEVVVTEHECMDFWSDKEIKKLIELHVCKASFDEFYNLNISVIPVNLT